MFVVDGFVVIVEDKKETRFTRLIRDGQVVVEFPHKEAHALNGAVHYACVMLRNGVPHDKGIFAVGIGGDERHHEIAVAYVGPGQIKLLDDLDNLDNLDVFAAEEIGEYHSVAVLLPDGTVFSAGGENVSLDPVRRNTGAIYMPHYLFNSGGGLATRPEIACVDTNLTYDQTFVVRMTGTNAIANVSLVRPSSVTHGVNMEQRLLMLTIEASSIAGGQRVLTLRTPANGNWAPPGDYMLFALNDQGVPSVAAWVRLAPGGVWSGTLPSNEVTWKGGEVHHISASLTVGDNQSLIVEPGAVVTVAPGAYLRVNEGELEADGATFIGQACGNRSKRLPAFQISAGELCGQRPHRPLHLDSISRSPQKPAQFAHGARLPVNSPPIPRPVSVSHHAVQIGGRHGKRVVARFGIPPQPRILGA